jgi:hypothetical protein
MGFEAALQAAIVRNRFGYPSIRQLPVALPVALPAQALRSGGRTLLRDVSPYNPPLNIQRATG